MTICELQADSPQTDSVEKSQSKQPMNNPKSVFILAAVVLIGGCSTAPLSPMSEAAQRVQVHRQTSNLLDKCQRLQQLTARADGVWSVVIPSAIIAAKNAAEIKMREDAAKRGGDTVVFLNTDILSVSTVAVPPTATVQVQGVAFKCNR